MCEACRDLIKAIDEYVEKADKKLETALKGKGYVKPKETLNHAKTIEERAVNAFQEQADRFLEELKEAGDIERFLTKDWKKFKDDQGLSAQFAVLFKEEFGKAVPEFVEAYIKELDSGLARNLCSKRTVAWIESWSDELGRLMHLNSVTELENILKNGLEKGLSVADVTLKILESGIRTPYYRARRVALTEMLRAHSVAAQEAQMQSPSVNQKRWVHTGARKNQPRWNHVEISGQVVDVDKPYELIGADGGVYYPMYPRDESLPPGESVNCHCISQPVVDENILGLSVEERRQLQSEAVEAMDDEWMKHLKETGEA